MWITIKDIDGKDATLNFDHFKAIKDFDGKKTTLTDHLNNTVQVNTPYLYLHGLLDNNPVCQNTTTSLNEEVIPQMPSFSKPREPMEEPKGKVGSDLTPDAIREKLTLPKAKSGTTSSALG